MTMAATLDADTITLTRGTSVCEILLFGAHVRSWRVGGTEQLFVSSASQPAPKALRGGVPICFPQFADRGPGAKHGYARTSTKWTVLSKAVEPSPTVTLELLPDEELRAAYPGACRLLYHVTLSADTALSLAMQVINDGAEPVQFTTALHTYFKVADISAARIEGLAGLTYEDCAVPKGADGKPPRKVEEAEQLALAGEVDRVYIASPASLALLEGERKVAINAQGFKDTVVWNIGADKASSLNDLGPDEWQQYVCIESALIDKPIKLEPHTSWMGGVSYTCTF